MNTFCYVRLWWIYKIELSLIENLIFEILAFLAM